MFYKRHQIKVAVLRKRLLRETTFLLGVFICYFLCTSKESNQGYDYVVIKDNRRRGAEAPLNNKENVIMVDWDVGQHPAKSQFIQQPRRCGENGINTPFCARCVGLRFNQTLLLRDSALLYRGTVQQ